jgi:polyhydroxyalkanoate synthesis regulator phasin
MQKDSKFFEDVARMASSATGAVFDAKREMEAMVAANMEKLLLKSHFVHRDELDALRAQVDALHAEIAELKASKGAAKKAAPKE